MNPKAKFQLDPQQQEIWKKNIPVVYSIIKKIRWIMILVIMVFLVGIFFGTIGVPLQIIAFCCSTLLSILFLELLNRMVRKKLSTSSPALYILGIITTVWVPTMMIMEWITIPDNLDVRIIHALFCLSSVLISILFLLYYQRNRTHVKRTKKLFIIAAIIYFFFLIFVVFVDLFFSILLLPITSIHLLEMTTIFARAKKFKKIP